MSASLVARAAAPPASAEADYPLAGDRLCCVLRSAGGKSLVPSTERESGCGRPAFHVRPPAAEMRLPNANSARLILSVYSRPAEESVPWASGRDNQCYAAEEM